MKVLIVEDEMIISEDMAMILEEAGYEVSDQVVSYDSAIESINENKPDLILLDINIQGSKDGIDIANWLNDNYNIPFIYTSSLGDAQTIKRAKLTNPSSYIIKPFKEEQLLASIEIAIGNFIQQGNKEEEGLGMINQSIFVKQDHRYVKIKMEELTYVHKSDNYLILYTAENKLLIRATITSFLDKVKYSKLQRTHKSYAVNFDYVTDIANNHVMIDQVEVPMSKTYAEEIKSKLFII